MLPSQMSPFNSLAVEGQKNITVSLRVLILLWSVALLLTCGSAYELQDTIRALREENSHLQHRLDNVTHALRELKYLLREHPRDGRHDGRALRAWNEWIRHGISAETHMLLEQTFCWPPDTHGAAGPPVMSHVLLVFALIVWSDFTLIRLF